ncbi:MAG: hypothetical protein Q9193_006664 [Seirophora villosa]
MSLLFGINTLRLIRRTFPTARTFVLDRQPNGVAYKHSSERPYEASESVKQLPIVLPNTWRANRAAREAKTLWINNVKQATGKELSGHTANDGKPLQLFIDHRPETTYTEFFSNPNAIVFPRTSSLGKRLSKLAHSTPWSERSRWITWPTYALVAFYSLLLILYILCRERVPITGRSQVMMVPLEMPPSKDSGIHLRIHDDMMKMSVPEDDPRVARAHSVLDRLLSASGLSHLQWRLLVFNAPDILNATIQSEGFVVLWSGIFAAAETDDELAAVLGHEMAHALAHHAEARLSGEMLGVLAMTPATPFIAAAAFIDVALIFPALPFLVVGGVIWLAQSRSREADADKMGMLLMTEAGFDLRATLSFFRRMDGLEQQFRTKNAIKQESEYLSTHPHVRFLSSQCTDKRLTCRGNYKVNLEIVASRSGYTQYPFHNGPRAASRRLEL